jgi:hypothetical protein
MLLYINIRSMNLNTLHTLWSSVLCAAGNINFTTLYSVMHKGGLRSWKTLTVEMCAHGGSGLDSSGSG